MRRSWFWLLFIAAEAAGQAAPRPGAVTERITSTYDAGQSYALFLPSSHSRERVWPVVLLMDPRGRALIPLERFRAAAERHGYILISSYNTLSDGPAQPNVDAVNAMLADARQSFRGDPGRVYLAGFSGTARAAWGFAAQLPNVIAGIFGAGASGVLYTRPGRELPRVPFYGAVGHHDFNYDEMRGFTVTLTRDSVPSRMRYFRGEHAWPPDSIAAEAIAWFELRAMKSGKAPVRAELIDEMHARDSAAAVVLEEAGQGADALDRWREMAADYDGLRDVAGTGRKVSDLARSGDVKRQLSRRAELMRQSEEHSRKVDEWILRARDAAKPPTVQSGIKALEVDKLRKRAADSTDAEAAAAATRQLEDAYVQLAFYQPREMIEKGKRQHALLFLDVAEAIKPGSTASSDLRR